MRTMPSCRAAALAIGVALLPAAPVRAQVDCSNPDNLCTGDPCVVPSVTVAVPCVVDFGSRSLIVSGLVRMPSGGTVSFTAATITVQGGVASRGEFGSNPEIHLTASGDLLIDGPVRVSRDGVGTIMLSAGANITVAASLRESASGAGLILLDAGGDLTVDARIVGSRSFSPGRSVILQAGGNIAATKPIKALAGADTTLTLEAAGNIVLQKPIAAIGNDGTALTIEAGGDIDLDTSAALKTRIRNFTTSTRSSVTVDAGGTLTMRSRLSAENADVALRGAVGASLERSLSLKGVDGTVEVSSSLGGVTVGGSLMAGIRGMATISAAGDALLNAPVSIDPSGAGGSIVASSSGGTVLVNDDLRVPNGGSIRIEGESVTVAAASDLVVMDSAGAGDIRLRAIAGTLTLAGTFNATSAGGPGGIIEGAASSDVIATGRFMCAGTPAGCIALSAGGTLDTTGATFDKALSVDCPGSPGGAFLDESAGVLD